MTNQQLIRVDEVPVWNWDGEKIALALAVKVLTAAGPAFEVFYYN